MLGTGLLNRDTQVLWNEFGEFTTRTPTKLAEPVQLGTAWFIVKIEDTDLNGDGRRDLILVYSVILVRWLAAPVPGQRGQPHVLGPDGQVPALSERGHAGGCSTRAAIILMRQQDLNDDGLMDFLLTVHAADTTEPTDDDCPVALIRQQDSTFKPITLGMLRAAGVGDRMLRGAFYAANGPGASGELVFPFRQPVTAEVWLDVQPITFTK